MIESKTESLCPHCLRRLVAYRMVENNAVYLEKSCPEHGDLERVLLWKNQPRPYDGWSRRHTTSAAGHPGAAPTPGDGCPYNCGICPEHKQHTCSAILEVTRRCNIHCPICFAASETEAGVNPDMGQIERMLQAILDSAGCCPIQLSGGEPTLRNDLPQIVALARKIGFDHIQINTNGVRLAEDADYGKALRDAGATDFFMQFDGLTNDTYLHMRGAGLLPLKLKAIERCAELKIGVILVPTLVKNVNDAQIGEIILFAKKWMPTIRGVHFQPMTYIGRNPAQPRNKDRILIPDILVAIEQQTGGELKVENFVPPG